MVGRIKISEMNLGNIMIERHWQAISTFGLNLQLIFAAAAELKTPTSPALGETPHGP